MDITAQSPEKFAEAIQTSYPFHPAIKDLYARFRENPGFQQTRALIRLMRIVTSQLWKGADADQRHLIGVHDLNLNDGETLSELRQINPTLENAIAHDIAAQGKAVAETIDLNRGGSDAQDACRLILVSSLANVPNAVQGLSIPEIIGYLCAPGRDVSRLKTEVLEKLATAAWYLHSNRDGKLYFKNVQNLAAKVESLTSQFLREQALKELRSRLIELFQPKTKWCYQEILPLPAIDELDLSAENVSLIVSEPYVGKGLNPQLRGFWNQTTYKNRVAFLTGNRDNFDALIEAAKRLRAIEHILDEMKAEKVPESDPQFKDADTLLDRFLNQFLAAVRETFSILYYPTRLPNGEETLQNADFLMKFEGNKYDGEQQVVQILKEKQKFTEDVASDIFRKKVEQRLFTADPMLWSEVKKRAATNPQWQWHRKDALDELRDDVLHREIWTEEGAGWIRKTPPQKLTSVQIQERRRDDETGEVELKVTPVYGDVVYAEIGGEPTTASKKVENGLYRTSEMEVFFAAVDSMGRHPQGPTVKWTNRVTLRYAIYAGARGETMVELQAAPNPDGKTEIRYTTDGSDPRQGGGVYDGPFAAPPGTRLVLAYAERAGVSSATEQITIPVGKPTRQIDPEKPITWTRAHSYNTTLEAYAFLDRLAEFHGKASGLKLAVTGNEWAELTLEGKVALEASQIREAVELLRRLVTGGQVGIDAERVVFPAGQNLLDWANKDKLDLSDKEWKQP